MPVQLSAGVNFSEIDLTTIVPSVSTTTAAFAGVFPWGPVSETMLVDSETKLVKEFGKPTNLNPETFFTAANFLSYSNSLYVVRAANTTGATPVISVQNLSGVSNNIVTITAGNTSQLSNGMFVAQSNNYAFLTPSNNVTITSVINATAIQLSANVSNSAGIVSLGFAYPGTAYSALALQASNTIVTNLVNQVVTNENNYYSSNGGNRVFDLQDGVLYVAKYPGAIGNSLRVSVCDSTSAYTSNISLGNTATYSVGATNTTIVFANSAAATAAQTQISIGDFIYVGNSSIGTQYLSVVNNYVSGANLVLSFQDPYRLHTDYSSNTIQRYWEFFNVTGTPPVTSQYVSQNGNTAAVDELHLVVVDEDGKFSGIPGSVLEVYKGLSRATDAKNPDNTTNYYKDVINQNSAYIWWANDESNAPSANAINVMSSSNPAPLSMNMVLGTDGYDETTAPLSVIASGYNLFASPENIDISLVLQGRPTSGSTSINGQTVSNFGLANYIIDNICSVRKDCVAFVSPDKSLVLNNFGNEATSLVNWRGAVRDSSYAVMDSGYKYQYDRYNDINRWIPMNGDIAGLCARTDATNDAWWSPAGFNRGQIKNLIRLAYNPTKAERDLIYPNGINPVVTFPGQGTVLYGDRTLQSKPSAFDRINVRRLFIVLEKAISKAARYSLFEFNDAFTRAQFKNLINPYLRTIQGRRGITDFLVVCDETNNTPQIIDSNQFIGDIYIKPARSINFIQLNFVAVGTGVQFSQVIGQF